MGVEASSEKAESGPGISNEQCQLILDFNHNMQSFVFSFIYS